MKSVLFLCVANSVRSQMAEGLARDLWKDSVRVQSAGSMASYVHPAAVEVLREVGIDISEARSKGVHTLNLEEFDTIITLCAEEVCPVVAHNVTHLHWPIQDPSRGARNEFELLEGFRVARDTILRKLRNLPIG